MRKALILCLVLLLAVSLATPGYCNGPMEKLGRGVANLLTWPLEFPHRIDETNKRSGPMDAAIFGLWEGGCMMVIRAAVGFWEVVTFPLALPENYGPVLTDPEYFIQFPSKR